MNEQTAKCPICGKPYKIYVYYDGDQSACQKCQAIAKDGKKYEGASK